MKKSEMVREILNQVDTTHCYIVKVYGTFSGVGYDLDIHLSFKGGQKIEISAHAGSKSWDCTGHLRPQQVDFEVYSGSYDIYRSKVINYWENGYGFEGYLERLKKHELEQWMEMLFN
jgi:hypothetical protein